VFCQFSSFDTYAKKIPEIYSKNAKMYGKIYNYSIDKSNTEDIFCDLNIYSKKNKEINIILNFSKKVLRVIKIKQ
jgi:hypothetical protein